MIYKYKDYMKEKNFKKLGFFSAMSICVGSIVGIGIFFKNGSIAGNVNGDGTAWLSSWIISGVIALFVAIHFGKIVMVSSNGNSGMSSWAQRVSTKKQNWFRHLVTTNYSFFYNSILSVVLSFFSVEIFFQFLNKINSNVVVAMYWQALISTCLVIFFVSMNRISIKTSGYFSSMTTVLKFIPLVLAMVVGISMPSVHLEGGSNAFDPSLNPSNPSSFDSFQGIMKSLPAALFAFDAFAGVGAVSRKIKGGEKVVSKVIVISMILVVIAYLLIAISSILHFNFETLNGSVDQIIQDVFGPEFGRSMGIFVMFFLFVSAMGTTNAVITSTISEFENVAHTEKIFYSRQFNKKYGYKNTGLIYLIISFTIWILIAYIPTIIMGSDAFLDGLTNFPVLFFFFIYSIMIFLYWKNIFMKQKVKQGKNRWGYTILVFVSVIGVFLAMSLSVVFIMLSAIVDPWVPSSWGLFGGRIPISNFVVAILHIVFATIFILLPLINYLLFRMKNEKNIFSDIDIEIENNSLQNN